MKLDRTMSNSEYHGLEGFYSSSQVKTMLEDPELFYRKYITKEMERETTGAMDVGTYFHTAILEPTKLDEECAVAPCKVRRGKEWDSFLAANSSRCVITQGELESAENLIKAVKGSRIANELISNGEAEVSGFVEIVCFGEDIYSNGKILTPFGWKATSAELFATAVMKGIKLGLKVRADLINLKDFYILDLKSTTGNAKDERGMRQKVSSFVYDLSAAMYLDIFSLITGNKYEHFYWTFASKDIGNCKTYLADKENIQIGRAKWKKAVLSIAFYTKNNWKFEDELGLLLPNFYEKEWLKQEETIL